MVWLKKLHGQEGYDNEFEQSTSDNDRTPITIIMIDNAIIITRIVMKSERFQ